MKYIAIVFLLFSCNSPKKISPNQLVGKWEDSFYEKRKDSTGKWSDWKAINYTNTLPTLEFTANGKILWDGKAATSCCLYLSYKVDSDKIVLLDPTNSELCDCIGCESWKVEKLTDEILEFDWCFAKKRYFRVK
jgi:hypothetical protein